MSLGNVTDPTLLRKPRIEESDWDIDSVVKSLRSVRDDALQQRGRINKPVALPSKRAVSDVVEVLTSALFPHRLSSRKLHGESVDFFVGQALDASCRSLTSQVAIELEYVAETKAIRPSAANQAAKRVRQFTQQLPDVRRLLDSDIQAAYDGDPAARSHDEVLACYPGVLALIHYRLANQLYRLGLPLIARMISELAHSKSGIDIHPGAQIGESFFIDHGTGVVVGETSIIGNNVRIHHGVTLGAQTPSQPKSGKLPSRSYNTPRHPIVEDDVIIYADATILGRVTVGRGSIIGANVCVTSDIPMNSIVTQAKSQMESFIEGAGI